VLFTGSESMIDERSAKNIATLKPEVRPLAERLILEAKEQGITIKVISGYRSYVEQDALYAQGRTKPGQKVTKARGGYSWHNFGLAFDVGVFSGDGKKYYGESEAYKTVGKIGESLGLEWGGSWESFVDEPHFQYNPKGYTLAQMRERTAKGQDLFT
jgi:peptidoglycan L-alanyl-D-glutamate endopeptidase CwlK